MVLLFDPLTSVYYHHYPRELEVKNLVQPTTWKFCDIKKMFEGHQEKQNDNQENWEAAKNGECCQFLNQWTSQRLSLYPFLMQGYLFVLRREKAYANSSGKNLRLQLHIYVNSGENKLTSLWQYFMPFWCREIFLFYKEIRYITTHVERSQYFGII